MEAVETEKPKLRYLVGEDARLCVEGRGRLSDEEWVNWQAQARDEAFEAQAREILPEA